MTKAEEVARQFRQWAARNGILNYSAPEIEEEADLELSDISTTTRAQAQAAQEILSIRKINLICVDDDRNSVIVYTHRALTKSEIEELPVRADKDVSFEFRKGILPVIRNSTSGSPPAGCSDLHKGRYTCGSSVFVGNAVGAGTFGCIVADPHGNLFGLSNNHVTGGMSFSGADLPITAPGALDVCPGSPDPFTIGHHRAALPLTLGSPDNANVANNFDAAIFRIKEPDAVSSMQRRHFDTPSLVAAPKPNTVVEKVGRTTGLTRGTVVGRAIAPEPVFVRLNEFNFQGLIYFEDFWIVEGLNQQVFSMPGDSGSLICFRPAQGEAAAVGILFAANTSKSLTYIAPLDKVVASLGVAVVSGHNI